MRKILGLVLIISLVAVFLVAGCVPAENQTTVTEQNETLTSTAPVTTMTLTPTPTTTAAQAAKTPTATAPAMPEPITITDSDGRIVEFAQPVERAIVVYSQVMLTMRCLGVENERVVGLDSYTIGQYEDIFPVLSEKTAVGSNMFNLDMEKVIELDPQVVISTPSTFSRNPDLEAQLDKLGIKVVGLDFKLDNVENVILTLGQMFGKEAKAAEYAAFWFGNIDMIQEKVGGLAEADKVKVYWENTLAAYKTISAKSSNHEVVEMAGGLNIGRDLEGSSPEVDPEWIITQNPDVIMKYPMGADYQGGFGYTATEPFEEIKQEIMVRPGFDQIKAVQDGEVYVVSQIIKTGAFENVAICYVAKILYPDLFADIDPTTYLQEMVEKYLGLDFEAMNGVFVYPQPW